MILTKLQLFNFRNYSEKTFSFSHDITIIIGPNASGKTTILEAIILLASGISFRADRDREMIRTGEEVARLKTIIKDEKTYRTKNDLETIEVVLAPNKKFLLNGISRRKSDIVGNLPAVLFCPEDLQLVSGSPSRRRRYLDIVLSQSSRQYYQSLTHYEKALRSRNKLLYLLKDGLSIKQDEFSYWEQQLIRHGSFLHEARAAYILSLNSFVISGTSDSSFHAMYDHSIVSQERFDHYYDQERAAGVTLVGPHRDDFILYKGKSADADKNLKQFGSRGEHRMGILWLKLAELSYLEALYHRRPVLLLDDIFSELDEKHRRLVTAIIHDQQTIMTTADRSLIEGKIVDSTNSTVIITL